MQHDDIDIFEPGSAGARYKKQMQDIYDSSPAFDIEDIQAKGKELSALFPAEREPSIYDLATSLSKGLTEQAASGQPASIGYGLAAGFNAFNEAAQARQKRADDLQQKILQFAYTETEKKRQEQIAINKGALEYEQAFKLAELKDDKDFLEDPDPQSFSILDTLNKMTPEERASFLALPGNQSKYQAAIQALSRARPTQEPDPNNPNQMITVYRPLYDVKRMFPNIFPTETKKTKGKISFSGGPALDLNTLTQAQKKQIANLKVGESVVINGTTVTRGS